MNSALLFQNGLRGKWRETLNVANTTRCYFDVLRQHGLSRSMCIPYRHIPKQTQQENEHQIQSNQLSTSQLV